MMGGGLVLASLALYRLSGDAVGMMLGMVLGVVACLPAWVLILIAGKGGGAAGNEQPEVRFHGLQGSDHIRLTGGGFDGTWRRDTLAAPSVQQPNVIILPPANTGKFRVAWQGDDAATAPADNVTRWATPIEGVLLAAGVERERRLVWSTEPVTDALASGGLCLVRADEWDAWQRRQQTDIVRVQR